MHPRTLGAGASTAGGCCNRSRLLLQPLPGAVLVPHIVSHSRQLQHSQHGAVLAAATSSRQTDQQSGEAPQVPRRTRQRTTSSLSAGTAGTRSSRSRGGSSTSTEGQQQQATWQRSRRTSGPTSRQPLRSSSRVPQDQNEDSDPLDQEFLDPQQAADLRKLIKAKGRSAVLDKQGFVRQSVLEQQQAAEASQEGRSGAGPDSKGGSSSRGGARQRAGPAAGRGAADAARTSAAGAAAAAVEAPVSAGSSKEAGRTRLFGTSQLQAAVPGSGGTVPALPVVRPGSSTAGSTTSPDRAKAAAAAEAKARGGAAGGFFSSSSWQELGASQQAQDAVAAIGISRPSHIQAEAFKALGPKSGLRHVALADQAGSGKTLAYLLPLLQQLKEREQQQGGPVTRPNSPSVIILTPTTELAQQVGRVVRALSQGGLRVRSAVMTGGQQDEQRRHKTFRTQTELLAEGVDVLVATPGRLLAHHQRGSLDLSNTAALVLDEVDVLAGGEVDYTEHIAPLRAAAPASMRCVLVSATLPQHTFDQLQELFMGLGAAFGPGLHRTAQGVVEELIDCSGGDEISLETGTARKLEALMSSLDRHRSARSVVFCNKIETCRVVENALTRQKPSHKVLVYHEAIREDLRSAALNTWLSPPAASEPPMVLVCTDRTSRGIDSMWCEHVVLFEFPRDPSEYVRRVGRTARGAGGRGVVSVLVLGKQVPLAKDILERNREGVPVHRVPRMWSDK